MSWLYLFVAALFEIGWPYGLKMASVSNVKIFWIIFAIVAMTLSGVFLYLAQREIPVGTAYAIWTGIGAVGTFFIGVLLFNDGFITGRQARLRKLVDEYSKALNLDK